MNTRTKPLSRRRFILNSLLAGIGSVLAAAGGWTVWEYLAPRGKSADLEQAAIPKDQIPVGGAHFFQFRGHPAVVVQESPGTFIALSAVCTHLGCIVQWQSDKGEFLCPCHAGRFSPEGKVLGGPPPEPLPSFPVTLSGERVLVG